VPNDEYPAAALDALLGATEQVIAQATQFDLETKVALADRLERMRDQIMGAPLVAGATGKALAAAAPGTPASRRAVLSHVPGRH
jgi:hypothetical protein